MYYFIEALKKYAQFTGRASRKEFWTFFLVYIVLSFLIFTVTQVLASILPSAIFTLIMLVPLLSIIARRLHDTGRNGWWLCLLVTVVGSIILLMFLMQDSHDENQYGINPKLALLT